MSATVDLTLDLIARNSVTPADQGCQEVMTRRLADLEPTRGVAAWARDS